MSFIVRPVKPEDYEPWLSLWHGYNAFYGRSATTALPAEVTQATWTRFFDPVEFMHALVAVEDGQAIGIAHYLFHRSTSALDMSCYMQDLYVVPNRRGGGIARALIEAVYAAARLAGTHRVYWHTHETNRTAQTLYDRIAQKSGFIVYRHLV